eukprot:m.9883 g.9883  ORF g.9883 m.9883 type:complete len:273 (-) comp9520_c0_seq1:76-894(-)
MPQLLDKELFQDQRASTHSLQYQLWLHMFNALLFVNGGVLYTAGSLLFYKPHDHPRAGATCFLIGSISFLLGASQDLIELRHAVHPSFASERLIQSSDTVAEETPLATEGDEEPWYKCLLEQSFATRRAIVLMYIAADFSFSVGSLFFYPTLSGQISVGLWCFIVGSIVYVVGMVLDICWTGAHRHLRDHYSERQLLVARILNILNLMFYMVGCILFVPGCFDFFPSRHEERPALDLFLTGSIFFTVGAVTAMVKRAYFRPKVQRMAPLSPS